MNTSVRPPRATTRRSRPALAIFTTLLIAVLAGLMFLTGCNVQAGVDTNVKADGSGTVGMRLVADKELQDALSGVAGGVGGQAGAILGILGDLGGLGGTIPATADELFNLVVGQIPGDWKAERGTDSSGARWLSLTRPFANPEELQQILSGRFLSTVITTDQFSLTQKKGFFTAKTRFSATVDVGSVTSRAQSVAGFTQSVLGELLTVQDRVTLPGTIKGNNADDTQGNMLVWILGTSGARDIFGESTIYNWGAIVGTIIAGLVVIAGLAVALVLILRHRRRKPTPEQPETLQPAPPSTVETPEPTSPPADAEPDSSLEPYSAAVPTVQDEADAPRAVVPIPLRPTRAQPVGDPSAAVREAPGQPLEPGAGERAASS